MRHPGVTLTSHVGMHISCSRERNTGETPACAIFREYGRLARALCELSLLKRTILELESPSILDHNAHDLVGEAFW
jgi:hypothetical protein